MCNIRARREICIQNGNLHSTSTIDNIEISNEVQYDVVWHFGKNLLRLKSKSRVGWLKDIAYYTLGQ